MQEESTNIPSSSPGSAETHAISAKGPEQLEENIATANVALAAGGEYRRQQLVQSRSL